MIFRCEAQVGFARKLDAKYRDSTKYRALIIVPAPTGGVTAHIARSLAEIDEAGFQRVSAIAICRSLIVGLSTLSLLPPFSAGRPIRPV